jgi:hypothetical protein
MCLTLDRHGDGIAPAETQSGETAPHVAPFHFVEQRR